jgi:REP element-mobilizing transposase RayT
LLGSQRDRDLFLQVLERVRRRYHFVVVGYAVMPEHFHLLITEPEVGTPSTVMQVLKQRTAHALLPRKKRADARQRSCSQTHFAHAILAGAFLRFQRVDDSQARRKTAVYASQSGEARFGDFSRTMALEQLSFLSVGRSRPGARE